MALGSLLPHKRRAEQQHSEDGEDEEWRVGYAQQDVAAHRDIRPAFGDRQQRTTHR